MKRLSDYTGDSAIELWADLLDPIGEIITDKEVARVIKSGDSRINIAKTILKAHKKEATEILTRIDPEPLNGLNVVVRLVALLSEIGERSELTTFFGYSAQVTQENASSGFVTESTEGEEN